MGFKPALSCPPAAHHTFCPQSRSITESRNAQAQGLILGGHQPPIHVEFPPSAHQELLPHYSGGGGAPSCKGCPKSKLVSSADYRGQVCSPNPLPFVPLTYSGTRAPPGKLRPCSKAALSYAALRIGFFPQNMLTALPSHPLTGPSSESSHLSRALGCEVLGLPEISPTGSDLSQAAVGPPPS